MKQVKLSLAVLLVLGALVFAYFRFVDSFTVRGGMSDHSGPPPMPARAQQLMAEKAKQAEKEKKEGKGAVTAGSPDKANSKKDSGPAPAKKEGD